MPTLLGIDTGGTYTDAVLLNETDGVLASAKSPTTRHDLTVGIRNAVQKLLLQDHPQISLVSLSSTLATNALVEGKGSPAGLILIGYPENLLADEAFAGVQSKNVLIRIDGGHLISGDEQAPLDHNALKAAVHAHAGNVTAFAVSGYFGVRNPSHELTAKALIKEMTDLPVTCGHELTTSLNAPRRAVTALLNARLIPLIYGLIHAVKKVLLDFHIHAPLMVVKGDGSLISAETALDRPLETILSGPAASVIGAQYLTGLADALVIDMGGTTSDMAVLKNGTIMCSKDRAAVGGFHPMISSIDILTRGIGGDSEIRINKNSDLTIGPHRVLPLCVLGKHHPSAIGMMKKCEAISGASGLPLFILTESSAPLKNELSGTCRNLLDRALGTPLFVPHFLKTIDYPTIYAQSIDDLLKEGLVSASSFTPTDAVNILGLYQTGSTEAAFEGARLMAARLKMDTKEFCVMTVQHVRHHLASALLHCALRADDASKTVMENSIDSFFIDRALKKNNERLIDCSITLGCPIIAVGAPAKNYLPEVTSLLHCDIAVPENAGVANAIGAVTGTISQTACVLIKPLEGGISFRVHTPEGISTFRKYREAEKYAMDAASRIAGARARTAGADKIEIDLKINNLGIPDTNFNENPGMLIQTEIVATAIGRPRIKQN